MFKQLTISALVNDMCVEIYKGPICEFVKFENVITDQLFVMFDQIDDEGEQEFAL